MNPAERIVTIGLTGAVMGLLFAIGGVVWHHRREPWSAVPVAAVACAFLVPAIIELFMSRMLTNSEGWTLGAVGLAIGCGIGALIWQYRKDKFKSFMVWITDQTRPL